MQNFVATITEIGSVLQKAEEAPKVEEAPKTLAAMTESTSSIF